MDSKFKNKIFDYSNANTNKDVFDLDFCSSMSMECSEYHTKHTRGMRNKNRVIRSVFTTFLSLIIDDCIENNNKFISPTGYWFSIFIREKRRVDVDKIRMSGTYLDLDIIETDGKIYEFVFYSVYVPKKYRQIRIGYKKYKQLNSKVNSGMRYYS